MSSTWVTIPQIDRGGPIIQQSDIWLVLRILHTFVSSKLTKWTHSLEKHISSSRVWHWASIQNKSQKECKTHKDGNMGQKSQSSQRDIEDFKSDRYWKIENDTIWQRGVGPGLSAGGWLRGLVRQYKQDRADFRTESFPCYLYLYLYLKRYLYVQLRTDCISYSMYISVITQKTR